MSVLEPWTEWKWKKKNIIYYPIGTCWTIQPNTHTSDDLFIIIWLTIESESKRCLRSEGRQFSRVNAELNCMCFHSHGMCAIDERALLHSHEANGIPISRRDVTFVCVALSCRETAPHGSCVCLCVVHCCTFHRCPVGVECYCIPCCRQKYNISVNCCRRMVGTFSDISWCILSSCPRYSSLFGRW